MSSQTITVAVPTETYEPFRQRAEQAQSSVEDAVVAAIRAALVEPGEAAEERRTILAALAQMESAALRQLVARGAETEEVLVLATLNEKRQREGLSAAEERLVGGLIRHHDRAVLLRAQALALLHQRGEDVHALLGEV